jgi:putative thiamine transport system ATP-binding protein
MLALRTISLALGNATLIKPFSLEIKPGEVLTLMGGSGSGKSSLLSYVGGDLDPAFRTSGDVTLNGASLNGLSPERRRIARLFQDDLLFPHMTVAENLLFAIPGMPRSERLAVLESALQRTQLTGFGDRPPHTLSGGQRQRIALMRALLAKPAAILLDEPFNRLDTSLRTQMRDYVFTHIRERNIPALLVTHDRSDAPQEGRIFEIVDREVRRV